MVVRVTQKYKYKSIEKRFTSIRFDLVVGRFSTRVYTKKNSFWHLFPMEAWLSFAFFRGSDQSFFNIFHTNLQSTMEHTNTLP